MNEENVKGKVMIIVSLGFLLLISIKRVFLGGDVDEITHYAEAYRLVQGDVFFKNVLEAQMTSSIPLALILKIWKLFTGGYEGGAIFARIITTILLIILSFFVYRTLKLLNLNKNERFILAAIVYLYLTKKMIIPDYSNMQNWIPILIFLFLIQYYFKTFNLSWLICSSVFYSLLVLSWPSYILMLLIFVPFIIIMNVKLSRDKQKIYFDLCVFGGGCIVCAVAFLCYLLQYQSIDELIENIQEMRNISGYSISFGEKIFFWIRSLKVEKSFLFINIITFILWRFT